jgi:hypothetical protein
VYANLKISGDDQRETRNVFLINLFSMHLLTASFERKHCEFNRQLIPDIAVGMNMVFEQNLLRGNKGKR